MKYPEMRNELLGYLKDLADLEYQKNCWVNGRCPPGVEHDELDYSIHFLFDDTELASNPERLVGILLRDKKEADSIYVLCKNLQKIFDKYGADLSDKDYIGFPEWEEVVNSAKAALTILS